MKSMKMNYPLKDVTFEEKSSDFRPMADKPEYPYGLRICLNEDAIKMLGLAKLPELKASLKMTCTVEVCSKSESQSKESGMYRSLDLQITAMELSSGKKEIDSNKLYAESVEKEIES